MTKRLGKSLVAILLIFSVGGHWALLQSVAWVTMVYDYSQDAPLAVAVEKTFDGKNPCGLCKFVKTGKEAEEKQTAIKIKTKIDFWMPLQQVTVPALDVASVDFIPFSSDFKTRGDSPPAPPPRIS